MDKSLSTKTVAPHGTNARFVGCRAKFGLELEGGEVGFVDFAEAEGVGDEPFASFDFYEVFVIASAVVKGNGEVLDLVCYTEFHQKFDEVSEVLDEVVIDLVCFDVDQKDYIVGEIENAFGLRLNDKFSGKCRIFRGEDDTIAILFIGHRGDASSEIFR